MTDEELKDLGLPTGAIIQLRNIVTKISNTNGLCSVDKRESGPNTGRRKLESKPEVDQVIDITYFYALLIKKIFFMGSVV